MGGIRLGVGTGAAAIRGKVELFPGVERSSTIASSTSSASAMWRRIASASTRAPAGFCGGGGGREGVRVGCGTGARSGGGV